MGMSKELMCSLPKKILQKFQRNFAACQFACLFANAKSHSKGEGGEGE